MKLAVIPPAVQSALPLVAGRSVHLVLAQFVLKYDWYVDFYKQEQDHGAHIILDNGAAENQCLTHDQLREAIHRLGPNEAVLPDRIGNAMGTLHQAIEFLHHPDLPQIGYMYVVHDLKGAEYAMPGMTIGVSKFARVSRATIIDALPPATRIHLLGFVDAFELKYLARRYPTIRSVDTAWPFVAVENGRRAWEVRPPEMVHDLEHYDTQFDLPVLECIRELESYCG